MKLLSAQASLFSSPQNSGFTTARLAATSIVCGLLVACGGGGGGSAPTPIPSVSSSSSSSSSVAWQSGVFKPKENFANKCSVPRTGIDPSTNKAFVDTKGTALDEKNFLRSWSNETYLWYSEIPDSNPASTSDVIDYFNLLKTSAKTASGNAKDKFHFTYKSSDWYDLSETGVSAGYGVEFSFIANYPPRSLVVAYTEPGSPADQPKLRRGAKVIKVDDVDFVNANDNASIDKINAGLFPENLNEVHTIEVLNVGSSTTDKIVLQSASVTKTPVQNVKVLDVAGGGKVGYFLFNDHLKTAERGLYNAINTLKTQGVSDLVLDIRYNGGGYLYIASKLAFMIAGKDKTNGKVFETTMFNDKHTTVGLFGDAIEPTPFLDTASADIGGALPTLNLNRVFVITSGDTCSASESIINGLRGVGVEVIQIGSQTCGKPYGFYPEDNCGTTYFSIQFKGVNNKGFGEYSDGFVPSATDNNMDLVKGCTLGDDLTHALGDVAEKNLATALQYRQNNSCTLATSVSGVNTQSGIKLQKSSAATDSDLSNATGTLNKAPGLTNRIMK